MITNKHPLIDPNFSMFNHFIEVDRWESEGWFLTPDWFPAGIDGYEWKIVDFLTAMMKPKPSLVDRFRYLILRRILWKN